MNIDARVVQLSDHGQGGINLSLEGLGGRGGRGAGRGDIGGGRQERQRRLCDMARVASAIPPSAISLPP